MQIFLLEFLVLMFSRRVSLISVLSNVTIHSCVVSVQQRKILIPP